MIYPFRRADNDISRGLSENRFDRMEVQIDANMIPVVDLY